MKNIFYATIVAATSTQVSLGAFTWTAAADDNADTSAGFTETGINSFSLNVTDVVDFPATGDGFDLTIGSTGGNIDIGVGNEGVNRSARFTFTVPASEMGVTAISFSIAYDIPIFPLNPDGSGGIEALTWLRWLSGSDITGDLDLTLASGAFDNPSIVAGTGSSYNGGGNFTINPTDDTSGGFRQRVGVYSIDNLTTEGSISAIDFTITPDAGGAFAPGSSFVITLDGTNVVPEPSSSAFLALGGLAMLSLRRRKN